jgi:predicted transcriptional regulator
MSPRAAWRLESLGFEDVHDYEAGKQDWGAAGLPIEGTQAALIRAADVARRDVPTCGLRERVGEVRDRTQALGWNVCVVINEARVVLGVLREGQLTAQVDELAERAMRPGPSTFRPNVDIREMAHFMAEHDLASAPVTTPEGRLVGMLMREDAEHAAHGAEASVSEEGGDRS